MVLWSLFNIFIIIYGTVTYIMNAIMYEDEPCEVWLDPICGIFAILSLISFIAFSYTTYKFSDFETNSLIKNELFAILILYTPFLFIIRQCKRFKILDVVWMNYAAFLFFIINFFTILGMSGITKNRLTRRAIIRLI